MSENSEKLSFLKENIKHQIERIDQRRLHYKQQAFTIFITATILSAVTTVLLGVNIDCLKEYFRIAALILTTCITVINAYHAFYGHKELWIANNEAENRLRELQFDINYCESGKTEIDLVQIDKFKKAYQDILNQVNADWHKNRIAQKK